MCNFWCSQYRPISLGDCKSKNLWEKLPIVMEYIYPEKGSDIANNCSNRTQESFG